VLRSPFFFFLERGVRLCEADGDNVMGAIAFYVPGIAVPKERPRLVNGRVYTPRKTHAWERTVAVYARQCIAASRESWPLVGEPSLAVELVFYLPTARRTDVDNLAKSVLDGLNGVAYFDDRQISELRVVRRLNTDNPRVFIQVQECA
jgi:crossover junction endodeoxyribonuclease RusA